MVTAEEGERTSARSGRCLPTIWGGLSETMGTHRLLPATESSPRHRRLPYRRSGRTSRTLRWLPPRGHRLQLMPQSQLSKVPIHRTRPLAGRASQGAAPRALLPRRPHAAGITRHGGITERATGVRAVVPCGFSDAARDRSRSKAPWRKNRLPRRAAHVESTIAAEPSLMMPGIIISFVFSEQTMLIVCTAPV